MREYFVDNRFGHPFARQLKEDCQRTFDRNIDRIERVAGVDGLKHFLQKSVRHSRTSVLALIHEHGFVARDAFKRQKA